MSKPLVTLILVLCILAFGNFKFLPEYQKFKTLHVKLSEKQTVLASQNEYLSHLESLSRDLDKHSEEFAKIDFAIPTNPNLASLFEFLQKSCSENRLILKEIGALTVSIPKANPKIKEAQIEIEVSGTFESFMDFLASLEKSARLIETSHISFVSLLKEEEKRKEEEKSDIFSFELMVKVHSLNR